MLPDSRATGGPRAPARAGARWFAGWGRFALACLALTTAACAPTSVAPSILRVAPVHGRESEFQFGVRTGPRIPAASQSIAAGAFTPSTDGIRPPEFGAVYELDYAHRVWRRLVLHAGVVAEFFGGLPLPALGLLAGASYRWEVGPVSLAPALAARGATGLGLNAVGGNDHFVAGEFSLTLSAAGDDASRVGLVPFVSVQRTFQAQATSLLFGGVLVMRFSSTEIYGGLGRAWLVDGPAWNVPLVGFRVGGS